MTEGSARLYLLESFEGQVFVGQVFVVDEDVALQSEFVRRHAEEADGVILLEGVDMKSLRKVIEWCKMHTPEKKATIRSGELRKWEDEYIDHCRVPDCLLMAVVYMEIKELEHWMWARIVDKAIALAEKDSVEMGRKVLAKLYG